MDEGDLINSFRRRLDFKFNNDRVVKKHRRQIYRYNQKIKSIWKKIAGEYQLIRNRHKVLATDVAEATKRKLARLRPNANQVYPRKIFRTAPPP